MKLPDLTVTVLDAVGELLGQQLRLRDARLKALEERPPAEAGAPGRDGKDGDAGVPGDQGERGKEGERGPTGIGLDAPAWKTGVHREGVLVQHHIGQHFRALKDTASEPPGEDWQRMGGGGFRLTGGYTEGRAYLDGDLFVRDFGLFLWHAGEAHLWAGRGGKGDPGQRGLAGDPGRDGKDGKDGAVIEAFEVRGSRLVLVQRKPNGALHDLAVDLVPTLQAACESMLEVLRQERGGS